jgi:hypothetical protein
MKSPRAVQLCANNDPRLKQTSQTHLSATKFHRQEMLTGNSLSQEFPQMVGFRDNRTPIGSPVSKAEEIVGC